MGGGVSIADSSPHTIAQPRQLRELIRPSREFTVNRRLRVANINTSIRIRDYGLRGLQSRATIDDSDGDGDAANPIPSHRTDSTEKSLGLFRTLAAAEFRVASPVASRRPRASRRRHSATLGAAESRRVAIAIANKINSEVG